MRIGLLSLTLTSSFNIRIHVTCYFYLERELNVLHLYFLLLIDLDAAADISALEVISDEEAVSISFPSALPPVSASLRDYVDQSETLSKLVQLGN